MTLRNPPNPIPNLSDFSQLEELVVSERVKQHASAKKIRRNRRCEEEFSRALFEEWRLVHLKHKISKLTAFLQTTQASVISKLHHKCEQGFEHVLDSIEKASQGLF
jgi:hypothetical protein